jgi:hypothetical protein
MSGKQTQAHCDSRSPDFDNIGHVVRIESSQSSPPPEYLQGTTGCNKVKNRGGIRNPRPADAFCAVCIDFYNIASTYMKKIVK